MKTYTLNQTLREDIAKQLYQAEKTNTPIQVLTEIYPDMTLDDAYGIQQAGLALRQADGRTIVGRKIGITSRGMMDMLHVDTPDYGYLLADTLLPEGAAVTRADLNIPIVEGELAFIIGEDLKGDVVSQGDMINGTAWVVPCFEVCDGRYPAWKVTVRDTISDNAGAARFMLGSSPKRLADINLRTIGMVMEKNGSLLGSAAGAEVMGSPLVSVTWLANTLLSYGDHLKKGDIVLSGAFIAADAAQAGDVYSVSFDGFPALTMRFE